MTTPDQILLLWRSGFVNRWHTHIDPRLRNSGDTTAAHSQRVATLLRLLFPDPFATFASGALWHDAPEHYSGDIPYSAAIHGGVSTVDVEQKFWEDCGTAILIDSTTKLCDMLDAWLFVKHVAPDLLKAEDWRDYKADICSRAAALGVSETVERLL